MTTASRSLTGTEHSPVVNQEHRLIQQNIDDRITVNSYIKGCGFFVPPKVVDNHFFESYLDTTDLWIRERSGIAERHWVEKGTGASELALPASQQALKRAGLSPEQIDGIIVATVTPDFIFPSTACLLQAKLGTRGFAFDVNAVCSGFVYALAIADDMIRAGRAKNLLVVGVDVFSSTYLNPNDRGTCILFGDGAGAFVLSSALDLLDTDPTAQQISATQISGSKSSLRGIYSSVIRSDGEHGDLLKVTLGSSAPLPDENYCHDNHYMRMEGREVFKIAVRALADINREALDLAGIDISQVDLFATHQANKRILQAVGKSLAVGEEKVLSNIERYGNTSAASIPLLIADSVGQGKVQPGNLLVLSAFGGGVTWGALVVRW